jgi:hypothetical protein
MTWRGCPYVVLLDASSPGMVAAQAAFAGGISGCHMVEAVSHASTFIIEPCNGDGKAVEVPPLPEDAPIGPSPVLSFSPDSAKLVFGGPDALCLHGPSTGALRAVFACDMLYEGSSYAVRTDDGRRLAFGRSPEAN